MAQNSKSRFSNRVEDYVKYRPGYPAEIVDYLLQAYDLTKGKVIADVGAGTGISAELFLKAGYKVIGVEPNMEMREKSVDLLAQYDMYIAIDGSAEQTQLQHTSVDAVVCGQAFHWFDRAGARKEFARILKPDGIVALIWNERKTSSAFEIEYDELIKRHAIDYVKVDHRNIDDAAIEAFFSPQPCTLKVFQNQQVFDYAGLEGRLLSSSYMPAKDDDGYPAMAADLKKLFMQYQSNNKIVIHYDTKVYVGKL